MASTLCVGAASEARRAPGEPGIWFVIFGDLGAFATLFFTFMYYRAKAPEEFAAGHLAMNRDIGMANSVLLLIDSLAVVQAVHAYRAGARRPADHALTVAIFCGLGFLALKSVEYAQKISESLVPNTNEFYLLYYTSTGIHFFHVIVGVLILVYLRSTVRRASPDAYDRELLESGGIFWHLVDLLWVVLFALFYLVH